GRALRQERALARCGLRRGRLVAGVRARVLSDREERAPAEQDRARHREEDPSPAGEACSARGRRAGSRHRCLPDGDHSPFPSPEIESTVPWNTTGADAPRTSEVDMGSRRTLSMGAMEAWGTVRIGVMSANDQEGAENARLRVKSPWGSVTVRVPLGQSRSI